MELTPFLARLIDAIAGGLPIEERPYQALARQLDCTEAEVLQRLRELQAAGIIKRLGIVVRHHELGYRANAMVVWNIADVRLDEAVRLILREPAVTLCYQRPRRPPHWPYNIFCMIHGRAANDVRAIVIRLAQALELPTGDYAMLFSTCRYKQRGARYALSTRVDA